LLGGLGGLDSSGGSSLPPVTVRSVTPIGSRAGSTEIVVSYSGALNTSDASQIDSYSLMVGTRGRKAAKIRAVIYNASTDQAILELARPIARGRVDRLTILGNRIHDTSGRLLDAAADGVPGSILTVRVEGIRT
jgi:hypothetical protein